MTAPTNIALDVATYSDALARAVTWISKAVDSGDDDKLSKALEKSEDQVYKAVER